MARTERIVITLICDHCPPGESADVTATCTVGYGASQYEIDLCTQHKQNLDKTMGGITGGARLVSNTATSRKEAKKFRDDARIWARSNGRSVGVKGIVSAAILAEYREYLAGQAT